ncbi:AAA family ATPase [Chitinophaga sp. Cy-1792]|uniref:AAA family ATPase n=1 Tax=Chitinophaga sp. Cy-1792 TaxID=2608339 RepID=UPI00141E7AFE|nr:AAA family ATPase [Chitinophaga sp. Cy-1792]NIG54862.1 AAA family ATPase [Chitinophaga sp. Cy-1792]
MEKNQLHKAHNYFIKLKNDGLSYEELVKTFSDIPVETLEGWNKELEPAMQDLQQNVVTNPIANELNKSGNSIEEKGFVNLDILENARLKLDGLLSSMELYGKWSQEELEKVKKVHRVFHNDLRAIDLKTEGSRLEMNISSREGADENEIRESALFYIDKVIAFEKRAMDRALLHDFTPDVFTQASAVMTYAIKTIAVQNYNGLRNVKISELPIDAPWIFITGENSRGKSSLLQAIFIGLNGPRDKDRILVDVSETKIGVEFKCESVNLINNSEGRIYSLSHLLAYGPSRLLIQANSSQNEESAYGLKHYSLFHPDGRLMNIEYPLLLWHFENPSRFNIVKNIFCTIIPHLKDIKYDSAVKQIVYLDGDVKSEGNDGYISFSLLASGTRSIIAMVGDMICRIFNIEPELDDPRDFAGIVLIDELDVHLHPKLQRQLPTLLSQTFPDIQFIVTTHSVIPFLGAPKNSVFLKVSKQPDEDATVERVFIDIEHLLPNVLLTSSLFDMDNITQINNENIGNVSTEDSFDEYSKVQDVKRKLDDIENSDIDFPEIS